MTQVYQTSEDGEELIEVEITQGEDDDPRFVNIIGKLSLKVPAGRKAGCKVQVTYSYDKNQRVRAVVRDETTGKEKEVALEFRGQGVLSDRQVERKASYLKQVRIA